MGLYEGIKDVAKIVQQADNIDLYRQLLDLGAQALDMQSEIMRLQEENAKLKGDLYRQQNIERHDGIYITLKDDDKKIPYCASCYGKDGKLTQMFDFSAQRYQCPVCKVVASKKM